MTMSLFQVVGSWFVLERGIHVFKEPAYTVSFISRYPSLSYPLGGVIHFMSKMAYYLACIFCTKLSGKS